MKTLMTLILSSSFLLTACGQDSKNTSPGAPAPVIPSADGVLEKKDSKPLKPVSASGTLPTLEKSDEVSAPTTVVEGNPSDFDRTPKQFGDKSPTAVAPSAQPEKAKPVAKDDNTVLVTPKIPMAKKEETKKQEAKEQAKTDKKAPKKDSKKSSSQAKSEYKGEGEQQPAPVPTPKPIPVTPPQKQLPAPHRIAAPCIACGTGNIAPSAPEFSGLEVTGLTMNGRQNYITLVNDGLMTSVRREMTRGGFEQVRANSNLAQTIMNGRMFIDANTGDRLVTVVATENGRSQTYNFRAKAYTNRLIPMQLQSAGAFSRTTGSGSLAASLACLDSCGKCNVAVLKLEKASAKAYAIIRTQTADLMMKADAGTQNADVLDIRSALRQVETAKLETFEVAYGPSMIRTVIMTRNGEVLSQVSPLVNSTEGALNQGMRLVDRRPMDLDLADLQNHSVNLSAKLALAHLTRADGMGSVVVNYVTNRNSGSGDAFYLRMTVRPVEVYPMTGALLR